MNKFTFEDTFSDKSYMNNYTFKNTFTNESYMNPIETRKKYKNRDPITGKQEAERRIEILPELQKLSLNYCKENGIEQPFIKVKGSTAINKCEPTSDLDLAIIVDSGHIFASEHKIWRDYQTFLEHILELDFKIEPRLIVEDNKKSYSNYYDFSEQKNLTLKILYKI